MADDDGSDESGGPVQTAITGSKRIVSITGLDAATGDRMQVVCIAASDRLTSAALLVALQELPVTSAHICNLTDAPMIPRGWDY